MGCGVSMKNYIEYISIKRRMSKSKLNAAVTYENNNAAVNFLDALSELSVDYLRLDQVVAPYLYLTVNSMLEQRYQDFIDYVGVLDDNFSLALNEFIAIERKFRQTDSAGNQFMQLILRQEAKLLFNLLLSWQQFLCGELNMRNMLNQIEDLQMRLLEYSKTTRLREIFGDTYLEIMQETLSNLEQAYKIKSSADTIRCSLSKHKCADTQLHVVQQDNSDSDQQRNSEADYVAIDVLNHGVFSDKTLSSRDLGDAEFKRRDSLVQIVQDNLQKTLGFALAGLVFGALIVATDGLIVPFLPVLEFALAEIITIVGCSLLGAGASQCVSAQQPSVYRPLLC